MVMSINQNQNKGMDSIFKEQNRLDRLNDYLIERNRRYNYVTMLVTDKGLVPNPKTDVYTGLLLEIRRRKISLYNQRRETDQNYAQNLAVATGQITKNILYHLTNPQWQE